MTNKNKVQDQNTIDMEIIKAMQEGTVDMNSPEVQSVVSRMQEVLGKASEKSADSEGRKRARNATNKALISDEKKIARKSPEFQDAKKVRDALLEPVKSTPEYKAAQAEMNKIITGIQNAIKQSDEYKALLNENLAKEGITS